MRLRRDVRGEVGVFEDLQTLMVIVVGIGILLTSTLYNWSAFGSVEAEQEMHDEVEHLIDDVESYDRIRAINNYGSIYNEFLLRQSDLATLTNGTQFEEDIKSDFNYNIFFDDLVIPDNAHNTSGGNYSYYQFGKPVPEDKETVVAKVQYSLVIDRKIGQQAWNVTERHACIMTVVVWQ